MYTLANNNSNRWVNKEVGRPSRCRSKAGEVVVGVLQVRVDDYSLWPEKYFCRCVNQVVQLSAACNGIECDR